MWIHLPAASDSGYSGMRSLVAHQALLLENNKITYSGSFGLVVAECVVITITLCSCMQFTFASNTATIIGGTLVGQQIQLRILSVFVYAFFMSVSYCFTLQNVQQYCVRRVFRISTPKFLSRPF